MKGLVAWNEDKEEWEPVVAVFHDPSQDEALHISDVYLSLWLDRYWSEAKQNSTPWRDFVRAGILKYRPRDGKAWRPSDIESGAQLRTLLSFSTACLICRDLLVVQQILRGNYIYRCLVRSDVGSDVPEIQRVMQDARVLHL